MENLALIFPQHEKVCTQTSSVMLSGLSQAPFPCKTVAVGYLSRFSFAMQSPARLLTARTSLSFTAFAPAHAGYFG